MSMATATATAILKPPREAEGGQCVEFPAVGWKGYLTLLRLRGERATPRMVYLDGTVWLMSLSFPHERMKERFGWLLLVLIEEFDVPCIPAGSTTFRRRAKKGGVEGDQTYYLANEARIQGKGHKDNIDLSTDPPPDLAIEVVRSHGAAAAIEVYRRLRVPEVWICDRAELVISVLQPNGRYASSPTSASFPFLSAAEVLDWVGRPHNVSDTEWTMELRRWARRTLKPRVRRQPRGPG